jgi:hypothetical protein
MIVFGNSTHAAQKKQKTLGKKKEGEQEKHGCSAQLRPSSFILHDGRMLWKAGSLSLFASRVY